MNRIFLILIAAIAASFVLLVLNHERGVTLGLSNEKFASLVSLGVLAAYVGLNALRPGAFGGATLRNIALWLFIFVGLIAGYQYRNALQDFASVVTAGIVPARPQSSMGTNGENIVTIGKSANGHFEINALVNSRPAKFLIDTGATSIVINHNDAQSIGLDLSALSYSIPVSTANGNTMTAPITLDEITIGSIVRRNMRALVTKEGDLEQSLLGMDFLNTLASFTVQQDQMLLSD